MVSDDAVIEVNVGSGCAVGVVGVGCDDIVGIVCVDGGSVVGVVDVEGRGVVCNGDLVQYPNIGLGGGVVGVEGVSHVGNHELI